ncbi:MAG TPA: delta-60 repeat domain-containing protein [Blastocatellia bacterium]|nr:delta-60 repeat domain-containing protein [Blastocatellia bacterium]
MNRHSLLSDASLRPRRFVLLLVVVLALTLTNLPQSSVHAAGGDLDPSFGVGGKVTTDFFNNFEDVGGMVIQPDGKIIVVGTTVPGTAPLDFAIARYNADGSLDSTFGSGGKVTTDFSGGSDSASSVALQSDGKLVVAGVVSSANSGADFGLARYNSDGSLDASFGVGGKVVTDFFGFSDVAEDVAIQADGKIIAAGSARINGATPIRVDFALARYNADGSLDATFGSGGKVTTDFFTFLDQARAVEIQSDGKIVAAGHAETAARTGSESISGEFALARYNTDGSLDPAFGSGGKVVTAIGSDSDIQDMVIQADGRIVAAGRSGLGTSADFALARYNSDGSPDSGFGSAGIVPTDIRGFQDQATAVKIQADGKVVVAGDSQDASGFADFALVRYNPNGSLDGGFGTGGKVITDFAGLTDLARAVAIQQDGKIVVAGTVGSATQFDFGLARYLTSTFNLCLQDESNGNLLQVNTATGEYLFSNCAGLTVGGTGTLTKRGSLIALQHNAADRRVSASIDTATNRATASIQLFSQGRTFSITDRNITNNTCACR